MQYLVRQWMHVLRQYFGGHGRISHIFYFAADSNPEVLLTLLLQNGGACPVDASGCSFALRRSHLENWKYFHELHVAEMRDNGQHFLEHLCQTQVPGVPVQSRTQVNLRVVRYVAKSFVGSCGHTQ